MTQEIDESKLKAGDAHYKAYVGPPHQYDVMGATQFRLLCTLGLRAHQSVLDFGCGSLRAGRLFIVYLEAGRYFGIEPNHWLIEEGIQQHIGQDLLNIKKPQFDNNSECKTQVFDQQFDFIVAQSVFSHAGRAQIQTALQNFKQSLKEDGMIVVTFIEGQDEYLGDDWIYPGCVMYKPETVAQFAQQAGLFMQRIPWFHPRQTWYLLAKQQERLPTEDMLHCLAGATLFNEKFANSCKKLKREEYRDKAKVE